jgi:superfamily II DNA or RNA helicase
MNTHEFLAALEAGVRLLTDRNSDHCAEDNDAGWNARDQVIGHSLTHQIGSWSPGQIKVAWRILSTYRNTQLRHLNIPKFDDAEAAEKVTRLVQERDAAKVAEIKARPGWGLQWTGPKLIDQKVGPRPGLYNVWSAQVPQGHPFWAVWKTEKEELRAKGYSLRQYNGWQLSRWEPATAAQTAAAAPVLRVAPYKVEPLTRPDGLLPYQIPSVEGAAASLRAFRAYLDASDVGTGKTYVALAAFRELGIEPVVVAPLSVLPSWERAAKHLGITIRVINWERVRNGYSEFGKWDSDAKKTFYWADSVKALVFDEVHRAKDHKSLQSRLVAAAKRQGIPSAALSATAASNPLHLKALGYLLGLHQYKGFWRWAESYGCFSTRWGGYEFDGNPAHLRQLHGQIFPQKGVRVRVVDLGDAFPETQITTELVQVADAEKINRAYQSVADALLAIEQKKLLDPEHHLTKLLRARQIAEAGKIPAFVEHAQDAIEQGLSVALFVNFDESIKSLVEALTKLKVGVVQIHGKQTPEERQAAIDAFQSDRARVIVCNIRAGGVGVSLHDLNGRHARLALISPTWSAIDLRQALGRVHRAGGLTKSRQRILFAAGTVEERVSRLVESKLQNLDLLNDGDLSEVPEDIVPLPAGVEVSKAA